MVGFIFVWGRRSTEEEGQEEFILKDFLRRDGDEGYFSFLNRALNRQEKTLFGEKLLLRVLEDLSPFIRANWTTRDHLLGGSVPFEVGL